MEQDNKNIEPEEELVAADDRVIGRALRISLAVIGAAALLIAAGFWLANRPREAAPERAFETAAPEAVVRSSDPPVVTFRDVAAASGVSFTHFNGATGDKLLPETMGGGIALFDYDNDGDADLFFTNGTSWPWAKAASPPPTAVLYANDGKGRFTEVTREAGLAVSFYGMGAAVGDVNGDGWRDLFLTGVGGNRLLENQNGRFRDVTRAAGVAGAAEDWTTGAAFFDAEGDGDLDLLVSRYVRWSKEIDFEVDFRLTGVGRAYGPPQSYEGTYLVFYRNRGDGTFSDDSEAAGVQVKNPATQKPMAKALGLAPVDVDGDGAIDVLVANDTVRKFFLRNKGDGTFEEMGEHFGLAYDRDGNATGAMGIDSGHYRNDANLGFMISNFANEMTSVYISQDAPDFFVDEAISEGIGAPSRTALSFGLFLFDYDLDGRLDMLQSNGHLEEEINKVDPSQHYRQSAQLFWNSGDGTGRRFVLVSPETTGDLARPIVGRGSAYADLDGDGDLDVVLAQVAGPPLVLRNEQSLGHHWLRLRLIGKAPNRDAIGAWAELTAGGVTQRRQVMPTRSYLSQSEPTLTFGLGTATRIDRLEITWPDGTKQEVPNPELDRSRVVEQGG